MTRTDSVTLEIIPVNAGKINGKSAGLSPIFPVIICFFLQVGLLYFDPIESIQNNLILSCSGSAMSR